MLFFQTPIDERRAVYLNLSADIERQLRGAYDRQYNIGALNQSSLGAKLGVGRSVINRRLTGRVNMQLDTLADMVWGLGHRITVVISPKEVDARSAEVPLTPSVSGDPGDILPVPIEHPGPAPSGDHDALRLLAA